MIDIDEEKEKNKIVIGTVESIDDPTFSGRIKVRVEGYFDNIPTEQLPWCAYGGSPINSNGGGGSLSVARVGQQVRINFVNGEENPESMEWYAIAELDPKLIDELVDDYPESQILLYDSANDISIKWQSKSGMVIYYSGSYIQIAPDNTITIHYGLGATGTQIQLSEGRVDIQAPDEINLTTHGTINLEADNIVLNAKASTQIKGAKAGECAINGNKLITALLALAQSCDMKTPMTAGVCTQRINSMKEGLMNSKIQYI